MNGAMRELLRPPRYCSRGVDRVRDCEPSRPRGAHRENLRDVGSFRGLGHETPLRTALVSVRDREMNARRDLASAHGLPRFREHLALPRREREKHGSDELVRGRGFLVAHDYPLLLGEEPMAALFHLGDDREPAYNGPS